MQFRFELKGLGHDKNRGTLFSHLANIDGLIYQRENYSVFLVIFKAMEDNRKGCDDENMAFN